MCVCSVLSRVWLFVAPWTIVWSSSSVHGIFQAKTWECCHFLLPEVFPTQDRTHISCIGRQIPNHWTTREVHSDPPNLDAQGKWSHFLTLGIWTRLCRPEAMAGGLWPPEVLPGYPKRFHTGTFVGPQHWPLLLFLPFLLKIEMIFT